MRFKKAALGGTLKALFGATILAVSVCMSDGVVAYDKDMSILLREASRFDIVSAEIALRFAEMVFDRDYHALLDVLVADEEPLPWLASNAAFRAAHIVSVARQIGQSAAKIHSLLERHLPQIEHSEIIKPDRYISDLIWDWDASGT